jgi:hypothetical protein
MLEIFKNLPQRWFPSRKTRSPVYQGELHAYSLELQEPLTVNSNRNGNTTHTTYRSDRSHSDTPSVQGLSKFGVKRFLAPRFRGWRFGALNFAVWTSIVFLINLAATIWGSAATLDENGGFLEGDCDRAKTLNTGIHLIINILSTVILSGSNYCMQCLSAPTRKEVDASHGTHPATFLDIGVPGVRNLTKISRRRVVMWCIMGLSSFPLHLL